MDSYCPSSSSSSYSLLKPRVKAFCNFLINPPKTHKSPLSSITIFFFSIFFLIVPTATSLIPTLETNPNPNRQIPYSKYCNHIVSESTLSPTAFVSSATVQSLRLRIGFFTGGDRILGSTSQSSTDFPKSFTFLPQNARGAEGNVYKVQAKLRLQIPRAYSVSSNWMHRRLRQFRVRGPKTPVGRGAAVFDLTGFWSESSGKLCMVGSGVSYATGNFGSFNVILKLNYPKNSSVVNSLVTGILESLDGKVGLYNFDPIHLLGVPQYNENYEFTLMEKEEESGCLGGNYGETFSLNQLNTNLCSVLGGRNQRFELEFASDCDNVSCVPVGKSDGSVPNVLYFRGIRCTEKGKMQMLLGFRNSSSYVGAFPFDPDTSIMAEGRWGEKYNQLCAVGCRIFNFTDSLTDAVVGDCSIKLSLRLPAVLSIRNRSSIVGLIWSNRTVNDSGYFSGVEFHSSSGELIGVPGLKYDYTEIDAARKSCASKDIIRRKGKIYPDGNSIDMRFDMSVRNSKGQIANGYASPLFVGDQFYGHQLYGGQLVPPMVGHIGSAVVFSSNHSSLMNISYEMSFIPLSGFKLGGQISLSKVEIFAEGIYNSDTGVLCMKACRRLGASDRKLMKNDSLDCGIVVNVLFAPLKEEGDHVKGSIESTRGKSDPFYFERLDISSFSVYTTQAKESIWRMDLEIAIVLITNTLACVFVGLQLLYVKKHPIALSLISVMMLVVLTLGYMIPLLLNFEAFFKSNQQNVFLGDGGWLESNEIIVRVITMVAFLLQFRLLQLTWSARQNDESQNGFWVSEKKVLYVTLPLYIFGGLIAFFVHIRRNSYRSPLHRPRNGYLISIQQRSLWIDLKSYSGFVLDGFLLPQIIFNIFSNPREKALDASFYMGTSLVRLLPHAYDLYRAHTSTWHLDLSYIYANHRMDFYSTAWDIIIPLGVLLFVVLIYFQQRFGGRCILPKRFKESSVYEKVPQVSMEEFQGKSDLKSFTTL